MKSYTIGREETCSIVIPDSSQMVSRLHATLNVDGGKMTITDSSSNGTYINGIRISSGMPVPVTRKDVVTFAQVAELDWKQIPNTGLRTLWISLATVLVLAAVGCGLWFFLQDSKKKKEQAAADEAAAAQMLTSQVDSLTSAVNKICTAYDALAKEVEEVTQACAKKAPSQLTEVSSSAGSVWIFLQSRHAISMEVKLLVMARLRSFVPSGRTTTKSSSGSASRARQPSGLQVMIKCRAPGQNLRAIR